MQPSDWGVSDIKIVAAGPARTSAVGIFKPAGLLPSTLCSTYVLCKRSPTSSGRALLLSGTYTGPACGVGALVGTGRALPVLPAGASCAIAASANMTTVLTATMILLERRIAIVLLKCFDLAKRTFRVAGSGCCPLCAVQGGGQIGSIVDLSFPISTTSKWCSQEAIRFIAAERCVHESSARMQISTTGVTRLTAKLRPEGRRSSHTPFRSPSPFSSAGCHRLNHLPGISEPTFGS